MQPAKRLSHVCAVGQLTQISIAFSICGIAYHDMTSFTKTDHLAISLACVFGEQQQRRCTLYPVQNPKTWRPVDGMQHHTRVFAREADIRDTPMQCLQTALCLEAQRDYLTQRKQQLPSFEHIRSQLEKGKARIKDFLPSVQHTLHFFRALRTRLERLNWSQNSPHADVISRTRLCLYRSLTKRVRRSKVDHLTTQNIFQHRREVKLRLTAADAGLRRYQAGT